MIVLVTKEEDVVTVMICQVVLFLHSINNVHTVFVLFAGGFDKSFQTDRASVECYDPEMEEWSFVSEMETPRSGLVLATVDHYLYAIGGRSRFHMYYDMGERYFHYIVRSPALKGHMYYNMLEKTDHMIMAYSHWL